MRQFFTWRFWLTLLALAGLGAGLVVLFGDDDESVDDTVAPTEATTHRLDLVQWVFSAVPGDGFAIVDGRTTADLALVLDGTRTMRIEAGTPGVLDCPGFTATARCTVAADLLGDAVLWFAIIPGAPGATLQMPAVTAILDDGWVRLDNGWIVRHAEKVDRRCDEETSSLTNFIETYGDAASSTFNFETQQIVRVTCPKATAATTTTSSVPVTLVPGTDVPSTDAGTGEN